MLTGSSTVNSNTTGSMVLPQPQCPAMRVPKIHLKRRCFGWLREQSDVYRLWSHPFEFATSVIFGAAEIGALLA
jgi:hypothetical protein